MIEDIARPGVPVETVIALLGEPDAIVPRIDGARCYFYSTIFAPRLRDDDFAGASINFVDGKVVDWDEALGPLPHKSGEARE